MCVAHTQMFSLSLHDAEERPEPAQGGAREAPRAFLALDAPAGFGAQAGRPLSPGPPSAPPTLAVPLGLGGHVARPPDNAPLTIQ